MAGRFIFVILAMALAGCSAIELNQRNAQATARMEANLAATVDSRVAAFRLEPAATITARREVTDEPVPTAEASPFIASAAETTIYGAVPIDSDRLNSITALAFDAQGQLLVSLRAGEIYRLEDSNADGVVDANRLIFEDRNGDIGQVSGLWLRGDALIVINERQLTQLQDSDADGIYETVTQLSSGLPANQSPLQANNSILQLPDGRYFTANVHTGEILQIVLRE